VGSVRWSRERIWSIDLPGIQADFESGRKQSFVSLDADAGVWYSSSDIPAVDR